MQWRDELPLHLLQARFQTLLLAPEPREEELPLSLKGAGTLGSEGAVNAYRRMVRARLLGVLRTDYPILAQWLGEAAFRAHALAYIAARPSSSFTLDGYGADFATWSASETSDAVSAALAQLDRAIGDSQEAGLPLHSAGATCEGEARLFVHPSVRFVDGEFNLLPLLSAYQRNAGLARPVRGRSHLVIGHNHAGVVGIPLSGRARALLGSLSLGVPLEEALEEAAGVSPRRLERWFTAWAAGGIISFA